MQVLDECGSTFSEAALSKVTLELTVYYLYNLEVS